MATTSDSNAPAQSASSGNVFHYVTGGAMLLLHLLCLVFVMGVTSTLGRHCGPFFAEFDLDLPASTMLALNLANAFMAKWFVYLPVFLIFDGVVIGGLSALPERFRWIRSLWHTTVLGGAIVYMAFVAIAFGIPLTLCRIGGAPASSAAQPLHSQN